jgi:hypothetical protein
VECIHPSIPGPTGLLYFSLPVETVPSVPDTCLLLLYFSLPTEWSSEGSMPKLHNGGLKATNRV